MNITTMANTVQIRSNITIFRYYKIHLIYQWIFVACVQKIKNVEHVMEMEAIMFESHRQYRNH